MEALPLTDSPAAAKYTNYWGNVPEIQYYEEKGIKGCQSSYKSPRGLNLFTRSWLPISPDSPRGIIFMAHGSGNDISWTFQATPIFLAQSGFACYAVDLEGHGRSEGLKSYLPNMDLVVQDCLSFVDSIRQDPGVAGLPTFLYGESMGGAICLLMHLSRPDSFTGAVLVAPMCKIADDIRPNWPIPEILGFVARFFPTLPVVPVADIMSKAVKVKEKKAIAEMNPVRYRGKPRLGTVKELLRVTDYLSERLRDVRIPFLVLHGSADVVTDPEISRALHSEARSEDKTIRIYEGMMHSLMFGETDDNIEIVRQDVLSWLVNRCLVNNSP